MSLIRSLSITGESIKNLVARTSGINFVTNTQLEKLNSIELFIGVGTSSERMSSTGKHRWYQDDGFIFDKAVGSNVWIRS